jgi:tetratricopeptide (TPR) repeat protein
MNQDELAEEGTASAAAGGISNISLAMLLLAGIAAAGAFATLFTVWYRNRAPDSAATLRIAMDEYAAGRFEVAQRLAESVTPDKTEQPELYRQQAFLRGVAGVRLAEQVENERTRRRALYETLPPLTWLRSNGYPPGRAAEGLRALGLALRTLGRYEKAIEPLEEALRENPTYELTLLLPLAECCLRAGGANLGRSSQAVDRLLTLENFPQTVRQRALLLRAKIETELGEWQGARETLAEIDEEAMQVPVALQRAQVGLAEAEQLLRTAQLQGEAAPPPATELLDEVIAIASDVARRGEDADHAAARLLTAMAYRLSGDRERALSGFATVRQNNKLPPESVAAAMEEIELLVEMGNFADALLTARTVIRDIGEPELFDPKWMSLEELRTRMELIAAAMRNAGAFAESIELAQRLPPIVEPARSLEMQAESHRRWGEQLSRQAAAESDASRARELRVGARQQYRAAGETYAEVARQRFTEADYVKYLWLAIENYQRGRDFEESLEWLGDYLRYEDRSLLPRGLLAKGRALLALGRLEEALQPLGDCVGEFPRDALRYDARLLMAQTQLELGMVESATELLDANLNDGFLAPDSPVFRDSLFALGEALYRDGLRDHLELTEPRADGSQVAPGATPTAAQADAFAANQQQIERAIEHLENARYRDRKFDALDRARRASYLLGEAHRLAAFWPEVQAADPETIETTRRQLNVQRTQHLRKANREFMALKSELTSRMEAQGRLTEGERAMLRNCFLAVADTLFELGELRLAAEAYQSVTQEYMNEPLALEAMLQQSLCYDRLGEQAASQRIYQQAADVLKRIPEEQNANFAKTTRYNRPQWEELIGWLQQSGA